MLSLLTTIALVALPLSQSTTQTQPVAMTYRTVAGRDLKAYVFNPKMKSRRNPAILLFHGGAWTLGDATWTFDRARDFANRGMVAICIDYRLAQPELGAKGLSPIDGVEDACAAFSWARREARLLGIDPTRVAGHGVSAGGHLVAAVALLPSVRGVKIEPISRPNLVLLYCPALNMAKDEYFDGLMTGHGDPAQYSPSEFISKSLPQTLIIEGDKDSIVLPGDAIAFRDAEVKAGAKCKLIMYPGVGHMLTRNLPVQYKDFDANPAFAADANDKENEFLRTLGYEIKWP